MALLKITKTHGQRNPASKFYLLAVFFGILAFIVGYIGYNYNDNILLLAFVTLLFLGILTGEYGNSKAKVGDAEFEDFLRRTGRINMVLLLSIILILVISVFAFILTESAAFSLTIISLAFIGLIYQAFIMWLTFFKAGKFMARTYKKSQR